MMAFNKTQALDRLRERGGSVFKDFITGRPAHNEIEFSSALAVLHNWGRIDWKKVKLRSASESPLDSPVLASDLIGQDAAALCEYPLFSAPGSAEEKRWGAFRADILFLAKDRSKIAYVENKIGAGIRHDLISGTIECLGLSIFKKPSFIVLTGEEFLDAKWYRGELEATLAELGVRRKNVSAHIMIWEDVFKACAAA
jgi:hypothetical protein